MLHFFHTSVQLLSLQLPFPLFYYCDQVMTDVVGNPEEERRADFFYLPWSQEAVCRYFYGKVMVAILSDSTHKSEA